MDVEHRRGLGTAWLGLSPDMLAAHRALRGKTPEDALQAAIEHCLNKNDNRIN